jgi:hypothetical protein
MFHSLFWKWFKCKENISSYSRMAAFYYRRVIQVERVIASRSHNISWNLFINNFSNIFIPSENVLSPFSCWKVICIVSENSWSIHSLSWFLWIEDYYYNMTLIENSKVLPYLISLCSSNCILICIVISYYIWVSIYRSWMK